MKMKRFEKLVKIDYVNKPIATILCDGGAD